MNAERIKEIQGQTAYPNSVSVQQALLKVWNECERQQPTEANNHPDSTHQMVYNAYSYEPVILLSKLWLIGDVTVSFFKF